MRQNSDGGLSSPAGLLESQNVPFPAAVTWLQTLAAGEKRVRA
jgi:hypothetical protein